MGVSLSGSDTIQIAGRSLADLVDQNAVELTFANELMSVKRGKNGNTVYAANETGLVVDVKLRLLKGAADDIFLNGLMISQITDPSSFVLLTGTFIKKIGDGLGNLKRDTYILSGGVFVKPIDSKSNTEGDVEQSISIYTLKFTNAPRTIT